MVRGTITFENSGPNSNVIDHPAIFAIVVGRSRTGSSGIHIHFRIRFRFRSNSTNN